MHLIEPKVKIEDVVLANKSIKGSEEDYFLQLFLHNTSTDHGYRQLLAELLQADKVACAKHLHVSDDSHVERYSWARCILQFFDIPRQFDREQKAALQLQRLKRNMAACKMRRKLKCASWKSRPLSLTDLPDAIILNCVSFLDCPSEPMRLFRLNKAMNHLLRHPCLFQELRFSSHNLQRFKSTEQKLSLQNNLLRETLMVSQLRVIQIRSCPNVDAVLLSMLNDHCNPFAL